MGIGQLYAIGGFDGMSPLKSMEKYDPATDRWTQLPDMTSNRFGLGACVSGGIIINSGGVKTTIVHE